MAGSGQLLGITAATHVAAVREVSDSLQIYLHEAASLCDLHRNGQLNTLDYASRRAEMAERFAALVRLSKTAPTATGHSGELAAFSAAASRLKPTAKSDVAPVPPLRVQAAIQSKGSALQSPAMLKSGDGFALRISPAEPSWIYVVLVDARGEVSRLYPARLTGTENPVRGELLIPNDGAREFFLDEHTGREHIYIYASATRVDAIEQFVAEVGQGGAGGVASPPVAAVVAGRLADIFSALQVPGSAGDVAGALGSKYGLAAAELVIDHR